MGQSHGVEPSTNARANPGDGPAWLFVVQGGRFSDGSGPAINELPDLE